MTPPYYAMMVALQQVNDPTVEKIGGVLIASVVAQLVIGTVFLIGFVAIVRKSIDRDIPAKLQSIDGHIADIGRELLQMRREIDRHGYKIESLEQWKEDTQDDTRSRQRRPQQPR
ncbi:MAG TPA: hypothetical protein VFH61_09545 [Thermoleophilia bacterium]|nr:hypothetical protein [Thermoleophilia bacterium]